MRKNRKITSLLLAGTLVATFAVPVSAEPGTTEQGQNITASTATMTEIQPSANDYIVFLPTEDGVEYEYDTSHMSEAYSTSDYTVLLYRPGEAVSFQVNSEKEFSVEDALQGTAFPDASVLDNGIVTFVMPEVDLCCNFDVEEEETEDAEDENETGEAGTFKIKLGKGLSGKCTMVDKSEVEIETGGNYKSSNMVDLIRVTSEEKLDKSPIVTVLKNGEKVEDTSDIVINNGLSSGTFVVDFKNGLPIGSDSYVIKITKEKGTDESEEETETLSETESPETEAISEAEEMTDAAENTYFSTSEQDEALTGASDVPDTVDTSNTGTESLPEDTAVTEDENIILPGSEAEVLQAETQAMETDTDFSETETETMSSLGTVGDDYEADSAVSALVTGFADTVRETATAVNITVENNIPGLPLVVKKPDGTLETGSESYATDEGILEIEFMGEIVYAPQIIVSKDGEELKKEESIIVEQEYLENGNLFLKLKPMEEIQAGNYQIRIG